MQFTVLKEGLDATTLKDCLDEMLEIQNDQEDWSCVGKFVSTTKKRSWLLYWNGWKKIILLWKLTAKRRSTLLKTSIWSFARNFIRLRVR